MNKRKEIAARLLERGELLDQEDTASMRTALIVIDRTVGGPSGYKFSLLFERLADLIDPTCKPVEAGNNIVCSECGADLYDDDLYCPHCGARVVRNDG